MLAQNEDNHLSCSGFDSPDFITYLDHITKPLKPSELRLLKGIHLNKKDPLDIDDDQTKYQSQIWSNDEIPMRINGMTLLIIRVNLLGTKVITIWIKSFKNLMRPSLTSL